MAVILMFIINVIAPIAGTIFIGSGLEIPFAGGGLLGYSFILGILLCLCNQASSRFVWRKHDSDGWTVEEESYYSTSLSSKLTKLGLVLIVIGIVGFILL